jgi:penicillin-binding protein 1A
VEQVVDEKERHLMGAKGRRRKKLSFHKLHRYLLLLLVLSLAITALGFYVFLVTEIPSVKALKDLTPKPATTVYGINNEVVYLILPDNRIHVPTSKIPRHVGDAFVAAEDADFFKHGGVDARSILRALYKNIVHGRVVQGGSTITQQVIKSLILGPEKSMLRKVREAILAYRLENYLTKQEILSLYLNNLFMGHGVNGVEAASQIYFGKHVWNISRAEATLLAGIAPGPNRYSPKYHTAQARSRQLYVIDQMEKKGFINEKQRKALLKEKIAIREDDGIFENNYFKDAIYNYVEGKYGKGVLNRRALKIYATIDPGLQRSAEQAVRSGLASYDERRGQSPVLQNLPKRKWATFLKARGAVELTDDDVGREFKVLVADRMGEGWSVLFGSEKGILKTVALTFKAGDVIKATYRGVDRGTRMHLFVPYKTSSLEGSLVCMDVNTGYILAMVGGRDFDKSPYNRAMTAKVQVGSTFKPFIYLAALKRGYDIDSIVPDEHREYRAGFGKSWSPKNYDGRYGGSITIRDAVAYSKNAATVGLLDSIGMDPVRQVMSDLGINVRLGNDLSVALGSSNLTLLDMVKGFSAFANGGFRVRPVFIRRIEDRQGTILEANDGGKTRAIPAQIAYKMNLLLQGVTTYGTAKEASRLGYPVAGKTGTTSSYFDALFVGYSPHICAGVWTGFDQRASLGKSESGGRVALPIWMRFMASALRRYPPDDFSPLSFLHSEDAEPGSNTDGDSTQPGGRYF